jgi:hypothetical protein
MCLGWRLLVRIKTWCGCADKRVDDWFLMDSMVPTLLMTAAYLAIVHYGSKYMQGSFQSLNSLFKHCRGLVSILWWKLTIENVRRATALQAAGVHESVQSIYYFAVPVDVL